MLKNPFKQLFDLCDNAINLDVQKIFVNLFFNDEIRRFTLELNKLDQLYLKGEDSEGKPLGEYTGFTEERTQGKSFSYQGFSSKKLQGSNYTLYDTGDFYRSFDVVVYREGFSIEADTVKEDGTDLAQKFGKAILGLSEESKNKLIEKILPEIISQIRFELINGKKV